MTPAITITVNSRWWGKQIECEVRVTRVTLRTVSYIALDKTFSGTLPQWLFLQDFQPMPEPKKKPRPAHSDNASKRCFKWQRALRAEVIDVLTTPCPQNRKRTQSAPLCNDIFMCCPGSRRLWARSWDTALDSAPTAVPRRRDASNR
jgi:hypothetical protein